MRSFPGLPAPARPRAVWHHRDLVGQLVRRELVSRYRGSLLGRSWMFLLPLLMLCLYTFVFGAVFEARWPDQPGGDLAGFALTLYAGLALHGLLGEVMGRSPSLVLENPNYVKKVVFPLEILPVTVVVTAVAHFVVGYLLLLVANTFWGSGLHLSLLALPLVLAPLVLMTLGLAWLLAALGTYFRDIGQMVGPLVTLLLFLGPVFFPRESIPGALGDWLVLNPLTVPVEQARAIVIAGQWPDWNALAIYVVASLIVLALGREVFRQLRKGFADVL